MSVYTGTTQPDNDDNEETLLRKICQSLFAGGGSGGGSGTVTSVSVVTANGVSGSVATATTTPAITLTLGAITPTSVTIGAGSAITSSGAGGALGSNAFNSTAFVQPGANSTLTNMTGLTGAISTPTLITLVTGTITTSTPALSATQTWNAVGTTFIGSLINVTNTASASGSLLQDWQIAGSSVTHIDLSGNISVAAGNTIGTFAGTNPAKILFYNGASSSGSAGINFKAGGTNLGFAIYTRGSDGNDILMAGANHVIGWTNAAHDGSLNGTPDTGFSRISANLVGIGNSTQGDVTGTVKGTFMSGGTATTCTGATIGTGSKNNAGFVTATTTGASTIVITFSVTAPTGWNVMASDGTAITNLVQTASSTTTVTLSGTTASGDVIRYIAMPY